MARKKNEEVEVHWNQKLDKWVGSVPLPGGGYRQVREDTEKKGQREVKRVQEAIARGEIGEKRSSLTFSEGIEMWIKAGCPQAGGAARKAQRPNAPKTKRKPDINTIIEAEQKLKHVTSRIGDRKIDKTPPHRLESDCFDKLAESGASKSRQTQKNEGRLSPATIKLVYGKLENALAWLQYKELIVTNPASEILLPYSEDHPTQSGESFAKEDLPILFKAMAQHYLSALWLLAFALGLRPGELRGILWCDFDLESKTPSVSIYKIAKEIKGKRAGFAKTKGRGKSDRVIRLPAMCVAAVTRHQERMEAMGMYDPEGPVFVDSGNQVYRQNNLNKRFKVMTNAAGLGDHWTSYDLRHTFTTIQDYVSQLVENPLKEAAAAVSLQQVLGHVPGSPVTESTYIHREKMAPRSGHLLVWDMIADGRISDYDNAFDEVTRVITEMTDQVDLARGEAKSMLNELAQA